MGASYSTTIPGATDRQKERYGAFSLRTKQHQVMAVLDDLIAELLSDDNNIVSLMKLLKSNRTRIDCDDMFIVLSSVLKKEFQVLKFPDPIRPSELTDIAYLPIEAYDKKYKKEPKRVGLCNDIAWFMVRLISLIFALTASLKLPVDASGKVVPVSLKYSKDSITIPNVSFSVNPMEFDIRNIDQHQFIAIDNDIERLAYIKTANVVIDTKQSIVFIPRSITTGIAKITIEPKPVQSTPPTSSGTVYGPYGMFVPPGGIVAPSAPQTTNKYKEYIVTLYSCASDSNTCSEPIVEPMAPIASPAPVPAAAPVAPAAPTIPSNNESVFTSPAGNTASVTTGAPSQVQMGGRRTRRSRRHSRLTRRRKYRGGAGLPLGAIQFILRSDGMTRNESDLTFTSTFSERVEQYLNGLPNKFHTYANPYVPLDDISREVIQRISQISEAFKKLGEGASPAQYRAYLLASQTNQDFLVTSFCNDIWANKQVTTVLAYALLDVLYKDQKGNTSTTLTQMEYKNIVDQFIAKNIMKPNISDSSATSISTFNELMFTPLFEELKTLCARSDYSINNPIYKEALMNAHKSLRDLYDIHMQNVIQFITKNIISPKFRGYRQEPEWILNSAFSTDSRGAPGLLESFIKEGRTMLAKHYFAVESIYVNTLDKLKSIGLGVSNNTRSTLSL